jgi:hypothetical protein
VLCFKFIAGLVLNQSLGCDWDSQLNLRGQGLHVAVVAVSDSKGMVLSKDELDDTALKDIISAKAKNVSLSQWYSPGAGEATLLIFC